MKTKTLSLLLFMSFFVAGFGLAFIVPETVNAGPPTGPQCHQGCFIQVCHNNVNECIAPWEPYYIHIGRWTGTDCIGPYDCGTNGYLCECQGSQWIP